MYSTFIPSKLIRRRLTKTRMSLVLQLNRKCSEKRIRLLTLRENGKKNFKMRKFGEYLLQHFSWQFFYVLYNYRHFDFENVYPRTLACEFIIFCTIMVYLLLSNMFHVLRNSSPHPKWHILNLINIELIFHFPNHQNGPRTTNL